MNTIEELIQKYEKEFARLDIILDGLDMHLFPTIYSNEYVKKKQIQLFIEDLKNLPNELRAVNRNENAEEFCRFGYSTHDRCNNECDSTGCELK